MKLSTIAALLLLCSMPANATPETCGTFTFCSKHFVARGTCGKYPRQDDVVLLEPAWEDRPIVIHGVTVGLRLGRRWWDVFTQPSGRIFAGNSYVPDVMALQIGEGVNTEWFPADMAFELPAKSSPAHVDLHLNCSSGASYEAWLILFYTAR